MIFGSWDMTSFSRSCHGQNYRCALSARFTSKASLMPHRYHISWLLCKIRLPAVILSVPTRHHRVKGTIPPCSKLFSCLSCMSKDSACSTGHVHFFKKKKYSVTCKKSTRKVLINFGFVTSFEDSHYTLLFRYIYGARVIQWFSYSKHLHVNCCSCQWSKWSIATSLSPKCYSANVPLDFCTTADFEIKYFSTKALLAFWVIPSWFSKFCRQNGYLNSKLACVGVRCRLSFELWTIFSYRIWLEASLCVERSSVCVCEFFSFFLFFTFVFPTWLLTTLFSVFYDERHRIAMCQRGVSDCVK